LHTSLLQRELIEWLHRTDTSTHLSRGKVPSILLEKLAEW
jgi:hypothetical protein